MPTVEENLRHWSSYNWSGRGDEWADNWGGPSELWFGSILPRIRHALDSAETVLEIAPGFGRMTEFLTDHCNRLIVVDLTERCIDACKERFQANEHVEFHVNDGYTLSMVGDRTIDLAFSYDSLVHAEADVVESYIRELSRVLVASGLAFLHHSNFGMFVDQETDRLAIENVHWRSNVTASQVRMACERSGLRCITQELVNWGADRNLTDCFSLIARQGSSLDRPTEVQRNPTFYDEGLNARRLRDLYSLAR